MYKPPENTNRVKAIKSKFENNDNFNNSAKTLPNLSRQLSDPVKVNIKRSPAFRNDKVLQRNGTQVSCRVKTAAENKSLSKNCDKLGKQSPNKYNVATTKSLDNSFNNLRKRFDSQENLAPKISPVSMRERSNTSAELIINKERIRLRNNLNNQKCFDSQENLNCNNDKITNITVDFPKVKEELRYQNLSMLYTEPVPKSHRNNLNNIHNASTLKITDKISSKTFSADESSTKSGHSNCHDDIIHYKLNALTDTLKLALKKPLPAGPAPKKPPRTFAHSPQSAMKLRQDFAKQLNQNLKKSIEKQKKPPRNDPKYMLDKLENALKNNKIRLKRQAKVDYTSEEDNCEDKNRSAYPKFSNFNCLHSLSCSNAAYEAIEPKSTFFPDKEEPVYAEPFVFPANEEQCDLKSNNKKLNRNSLYYMRTKASLWLRYINVKTQSTHNNKLNDN